MMELKLAEQWLKAGKFISWTSPLEENKSFGELNIFTIQKGDMNNPVILLIHGYPTNSFDFMELFDLLCMDYYVCALDTPGYGFSDKPQNGYKYSIVDDANLVDYYITQVLKAKSLTILSHDKGNSVGLALLGLYKNQTQYTIDHHFITNGNIYLPLAKLTRIQKLLLNHSTGPRITKLINGKMLAKGLNKKTHNIKESREKVDAIAYILDYQNGGRIQYNIIQYLNQRKQHEVEWLGNLQASSIPTTMIWGEDDKIAPTAVPDYVWGKYLQNRAVESHYWRIPNANHYLQNDKAEILSILIRKTLGEEVDCENISPADRPYEYRLNRRIAKIDTKKKGKI